MIHASLAPRCGGDQRSPTQVTNTSDKPPYALPGPVHRRHRTLRPLPSLHIAVRARMVGQAVNVLPQRFIRLF